ncbi:sigma-70 family RNA polymerase sigma factor [Nonomuraea sp. NPDC050328]|uniref:sigma-70 family RNA polymerase sigma factor n=1 Tax=Nonomuraea sp. NPDC050328 TaxID=3364361 RepID=UPI0037B4D39B
MPGWPTVDRADDHQLMEALRRADGQASATLYDAYAERLHDYACSLLGDRDSAADAVHDALITAQGCAEQLKEVAKLRAWLYALTRFQAVARVKTRPAELTPPPVLDDPEDPELAELVHEALGELSRNEREVLELSLRHGLTPAEVGSVLGLTSRQATGRLTRARDHMENAAAAVVLARNGRAHCPDLSAMLDSWEGPLTPLLRRRLSGHIAGCEVCTEGKHRQVAAGRLLELMPIAFPPISLRRRVIDTSAGPEYDQTRTLITERTESFDKTGFPVAAEPRRSRRRPRRLAPVIVAAACVLLGTGAVAYLGQDGGPQRTAMSLSPTGAATGDPSLPAPDEFPTEEDEAPAETEEPEPTPEPGTSRPVTPTPRRPQADPPATTRPAAGPRTRRPNPPAARLTVGCPGAIDGSGSVRLSARNGAVTWSAKVTGGLSLGQSGGRLGMGQSASVTVIVEDPTSSGLGTVTVSSTGGGGTCSISWRGDEPPPSGGPGTDRPSPGPGPSESPQSTQTDPPAEPEGFDTAG